MAPDRLQLEGGVGVVNRDFGKRDLLLPCPGCQQDRMADAGHHLCRGCEGYATEEDTDD